MSIILPKIIFPHKTCEDENGNSIEITENSIDLYIVMTRNCNVHCPFCTYHSLKENTSQIEINKVKETLDELSKICILNTIHFTGGEPTLELDKIIEISTYAKKIFPSVITSVNTNGSFLSSLGGLQCLDNIALSRHHYDDEKNWEIFGNKLPPTKDMIASFPDKNKLHLSCNLIKGYIDNEQKLEDFLEFSSHIEVNDIGIVSLMDNCKYSIDNFIDFEQFDLSKIEHLKKCKIHCKKDENNISICRCENYLYQAQNMRLISMYHRHAIKSNNIADYLVINSNENNNLTQGFK
jgi:pyruvate-formate lyase-activating enzyme